MPLYIAAPLMLQTDVSSKRLHGFQMVVPSARTVSFDRVQKHSRAEAQSCRSTVESMK